MLLPRVAMLYLRSPVLLHLVVGSLFPLTNMSPLQTPGNCHFTFWFSEFVFFEILHLSEITWYLSMLSFFSLSVMFSRFISMLSQVVWFPSFLWLNSIQYVCAYWIVCMYIFSIHLVLLVTEVVSISWLLLVMNVSVQMILRYHFNLLWICTEKWNCWITLQF